MEIVSILRFLLPNAEIKWYDKKNKEREGEIAVRIAIVENEAVYQQQLRE